MAQYEQGDGPKIEFGETGPVRRRPQAAAAKTKAKARPAPAAPIMPEYRRKSPWVKWIILLIFMLAILAGLISYAILVGANGSDSDGLAAQETMKTRIEALEARVMTLEDKIKDLESKKR